MTARRNPKRTHPSPPLRDHVVAFGVRCGNADPKAVLPDHEVAFGLRFGNANTNTPR